jgi:DNA polymerase (family X)
MGRRNDEVAALLQEYADLLAVTGGAAFKARVYEKAARSIAGHPTDVSTLDTKELRAIPNVGESIAQKVHDYLTTGRMAALDQVRAKIPSGVLAMTRIPTLGPAKALVLYRELGIASVADLERALDAGALDGLRGFGPKTLANIRTGIALLSSAGGRILLSDATPVAEELVALLSAVKGCRRCQYAGSLRRVRETIGDVDILAAARDSNALMAAFASAPIVDSVLARGPTKTSVRTAAGLQVDLRVVAPDCWGAALQYFTGSKAHNVRIREIAVRKGLTLSEYGLTRVDGGTVIASRTEEEVYQALGLPWMEPTLREDRGEVEAALAGTLPRLVTVADVRGDLHTHTDLTDGVSSLAEMLAAAVDRGLEYMAVTDHAKDLPMQRMTEEKMLTQRAQVRALAGSARPRVLHGTELNIGPDGGVDWDADFLAGFDLCVASVHSHFNQSARAMTARLIRACENPYVTVIGHPTTRLLGRREPVEADFDAVFAAASGTGTAMEINCAPDRLDLPDHLIRRAKHHGVVFAINTDAHAVTHLDNLRYGVSIAQRGWLTPDDVINTWPLARLRRFIAAKRARSGR